jgi:ribosomal protein L40E
MAGDAFDKLMSSFNRGITTISVKTSSSLEKSKIKTHMESLARDIEKDLHLVGEEAYKIWGSETQDYSALNERFEAIKRKQDEITRLEADLAAIDERDSQILGTAERQEAVAVATPKLVCSNCNAQYETAVKFCRRCGNKLAE